MKNQSLKILKEKEWNRRRGQRDAGRNLLKAEGRVQSSGGTGEGGSEESGGRKEGSKEAKQGSKNRRIMFDILLCYLYKRIADTEELAQWFRGLCAEFAAVGRVLVSPDGININVAVPAAEANGAGERSMATFCDRIEARMGNENIDFKVERNAAESPPFPDLAVKLCKEPIAEHGRVHDS